MASVEAVAKNVTKSKWSNSMEVEAIENVDREALREIVDPDESFLMWARQVWQFGDEKSVIIAAYKEGKFKRLSLIDIINKLKDLDYFEAVEAVNQLPHPFFTKITFDSVSMVEIFADTVDSIEGSAIRVVDSSIMPKTCIIAIANLPPELIETQVYPLLSEWGKPLKLSKQFIPKASGGNVQVGTSRVEFKLNDGVSILDVPYFVKVFGLKVYLYIKGRPRICFRCNKSDHLVKDCPVRFCGFCRSLKPVRHGCKLSFAAVVAASDVNSSTMLLNDNLLVELMEVENKVVAGDELGGDELQVVKKKEKSEEKIIVALDNVRDFVTPEVMVKAVKKDKGVAVVKRMRTRSLSGSFQRTSFSKSVSGESLEVKSQEDRAVGGKRRKNKNGRSIAGNEKSKAEKKMGIIGGDRKGDSGVCLHVGDHQAVVSGKMPDGKFASVHETLNGSVNVLRQKEISASGNNVVDKMRNGDGE